ncbi:MAG: YgaP-like transmembrane domain [Candidatus Limnocylindrales bacterium]
MTFVTFMNSTAGRAARILAGLALMVVGLAVVGGTGGVVLAVVGLVPLGAGLANVCLFGPLLGVDLHGNPKAVAR